MHDDYEDDGGGVLILLYQPTNDHHKCRRQTPRMETAQYVGFTLRGAVISFGSKFAFYTKRYADNGAWMMRFVKTPLQFPCSEKEKETEKKDGHRYNANNYQLACIARPLRMTI